MGDDVRVCMCGILVWVHKCFYVGLLLRPGDYEKMTEERVGKLESKKCDCVWFCSI